MIIYKVGSHHRPSYISSGMSVATSQDEVRAVLKQPQTSNRGYTSAGQVSHLGSTEQVTEQHGEGHYPPPNEHK